MAKDIDRLRALIRNVPDFPEPGILFYDITTLLKDAAGFRQAVAALADPFREAQVDAVVGIESRGFIFGAAVADSLGVGFVPVRKPGKLPAETIRASYQLEYGEDSVEMHCDAVEPGQRALIVDDLLATGGTAQATASLVQRGGAEVVGIAVLIELVELDGRSRLGGERVHAVLQC